MSFVTLSVGMMWFVGAMIVITVAQMGISLYQMLTYKAPQPPVPSAQSVSYIPTAELGKAIPVVFGTRIVTQPNVVWWGSPRSIPNSVNMS